VGSALLLARCSGNTIANGQDRLSRIESVH
jgi:hypothetical protein